MIKRLLTTIVCILLGSASYVCAMEWYQELREFYTTKLFAVETRMSVLEAKRERNQQDDTELISLKEERSVIAQRIGACFYYNREVRPPQAQRDISREEIDRIIEKRARKYGINPDFIRAIVRCESNYDPSAMSSAGAIGLMQLMPETAREMGVENPWSPVENIEGGVKYMVRLLMEFKDVTKALQAYNFGPDHVKRGVNIPRETRIYTQRVLGCFLRLNRYKENQGDMF